MSKFDKISNYTVEYENFLKIIKEYEGYLVGLSNNNIFLFAENMDKDARNQYASDIIDINKENDQDLIYKRNLAPKLFDRTSGNYFTYNLARESSLRNLGLNDTLGDYLHILFSKRGLGGVDAFASDVKPKGFSDAILRHTLADSINGKYGIEESLPYVNGIKLIKENKKNAEGKDIVDSNGEIVTQLTDFSAKDGTLTFHDTINNENFPDRFKKPNISCFVSRVHDVGVLARQKSHLPIFFGGIPPIEMSRCVPYIDVKIISLNLDSKKDDPLDVVSFMRFSKNKDGEFITQDGIGLMNATTDSVDEITNETSSVSFMDIFNSPQTMANANINKENNGGRLFGNTFGLGSLNNQASQVYDPITPFMTLKNLNVSITGAGIGLFASKKASLNLVLHDRSRLKDIAPLVSIDQFATTKIQIEFGWNHPDGGVNSDNIIGQYLDALKDVHTYQVVGSDYSFGSSNSIDLTVKLTAYGYRTASGVHCGAGEYVPLNAISDLIILSANQASNSIEVSGQPKEKIAEVRQKIRLNARSARKLSSIITWEEWNSISSLLKKDKKEFLKYLSTFLRKISGDESVNSEGVGTFDPLAESDHDDNKETLIESIFSKLSGLENDRSDPFVYSLHKDAKFSEYNISNATNFRTGQNAQDIVRYEDLVLASRSKEKNSPFCSLGKLLLNYVGLPVASTCLYDEVQMVFYPLNHHAGKARGHTTASLPINLIDVEKALIERLEQNVNLSVKGFFNLIEREIISNRSLPVYGFSDLTSFVNLEKAKDDKTPEERFFACIELIADGDAIITGIESPTGSEFINQFMLGIENFSEINYTTVTADIENNAGDSEIKKKKFEELDNIQDRSGTKLKKEVRELYTEYTAQLAKLLRGDITSTCKEFYSKDGLSTMLTEPKFVKPNLVMLFEVCPAIDTKFEDDQSGAASDSGLSNKTILKIHVYDEESVSTPTELTLLSSLIDNVSGETLIGNSKEINKKVINNLTFYDAKEFVKRSLPTIIYGSSTTTVKSLSVSANTSGELSKVLMIESYGNINNPQGGHDHETVFEEVTVYPNSISCTLMGMPMISRGTSIFVDFGTNTSLDNIYTVKSISHAISKGDFSTDLELVPSNMGAISSFRDKLSIALGISQSDNKKSTQVDVQEFLDNNPAS